MVASVGVACRASSSNSTSSTSCALTPSISQRVAMERSAMNKLRIVRVWQGDRKWSLNDGQTPNVRVVRVEVSMGYNGVDGH